MQELHTHPLIALDRGIYLLEFYARWCGTCRAVTRRLQELEEEMGFSGITVDIEQMPIVAKNFRIKGVPILVLIQDGIEMGRIGGSLEKEEIRAWVLEFGLI